MGHGKTNVISIVYGMKGYGKSYLLEMRNGLKPRVLWFDPFGLYSTYSDSDFRSIFPGWTKTSNIVETVEMIAGRETAVYVRPFRRWIKEPVKDFRIMYSVPEGEDEEAHLAALYEALRKRYQRLGEAKAQRTTIVVDEVDGLNRGYNASKTVEAMVKRGRHIILDQWYATRRPYEIPRLVSSQANVKFIFRIEERRDLQYLIEAGVPRAVVTELPHSAKGEYYRIEPEGDPVVSHYKPPAPV